MKYKAIIYIKITKNWENPYKHLDLFLSAYILKIPGNKYKAKGVIKEVAKLNNESLIKCICVFLYIPQKQVT